MKGGADIMRKSYDISQLIIALGVDYDEFLEMTVSEILERLSSIDE